MLLVVANVTVWILGSGVADLLYLFMFNLCMLIILYAFMSSVDFFFKIKFFEKKIFQDCHQSTRQI